MGPCVSQLARIFVALREDQWSTRSKFIERYANSECHPMGIAKSETSTTSAAGASTTFDLRRVTLMSAGHLINDMYGNLATSLAPYFVLRGRLSEPVAGALVLVYLAGSSVLQPLFGLISDRTGRRWFAVLGPAWIGIAMSLLVTAPTNWLIFVLVALGGIGTAAFHPQGASMVDRVATRARGWGMAIFSMGGNLGYAIGPLLATALIAVGAGWSALVAIPGLALSGLLYRYAPLVGSHQRGDQSQTLRQATHGSVLSLALIVLIIAIRSGCQLGFIFLMPLYFHSYHLAANLGSYASTLFLLAGALGGLYGGRLSDRIGRRPVVVWSLAMATPLLLLVALIPPMLIWPVVALAGAALLAANSVNVVQAQELLPGNTGVAAGLTLGLGFGLSGVITFLLSAYTKQVGPYQALITTALLPLLAALLAILVRPSQRAMR
jgi:FSR family fosmidomycin resistance protein-like MFS transporter